MKGVSRWKISKRRTLRVGGILVNLLVSVSTPVRFSWKAGQWGHTPSAGIGSDSL